MPNRASSITLAAADTLAVSIAPCPWTFRLRSLGAAMVLLLAACSGGNGTVPPNLPKSTTNSSQQDRSQQLMPESVMTGTITVKPGSLTFLAFNAKIQTLVVSVSKDDVVQASSSN